MNNYNFKLLIKHFFLGAIVVLQVFVVSCSNNNSVNERIVLISEPDKKLRLKYDSLVTADKAVINHQDTTFVEYMGERLQPIRTNVKRINSITHWDKINKKDVWFSTEGGTVEEFYKNDSIHKVTYNQLGEVYKREVFFYLLRNKLSYVKEISYSYNRPIYWDSTRMLESGDNEVFDYEKSEITVDESFFEKETLIRQINDQDCGAPFASDYLKEEEDRLLTEFHEILNSN